MSYRAPHGVIGAHEIAALLSRDPLRLVMVLLPDGKRRGAEWCTGTNRARNNFTVRLTGGKAGVWKDWAAGVGGDALDLVAYVLFGGNKKDAIRWARAWLGLEGADPAALRQVRAQAQKEDGRRHAEADRDAEQMRSAARAMWIGAEERLAGTPVDAYLRGRGICLAELGRQPRALRYHPRLWHAPSQRHWPAMVAAITDGAGQHTATHRTFLEVRLDGRVVKAPIEPNKMVLGAYGGASIRLWRGASGRSLREARPGEMVDVTEGIEDGLSVAVSCPEHRIVAAVSLGNIGALVFPPAITSVRLWKQNDTKAAAIEAFQRAAWSHAKRGLTVLIAQIPGEFKDANDLLRAGLPDEASAA